MSAYSDEIKKKTDQELIELVKNVDQWAEAYNHLVLNELKSRGIRLFKSRFSAIYPQYPNINLGKADKNYEIALGKRILVAGRDSNPRDISGVIL